MKVLISTEARGAVQRELARARLAAIPFVSAREQREIERKYGKPSRGVARTIRVRI